MKYCKKWQTHLDTLKGKLRNINYFNNLFDESLTSVGQNQTGNGKEYYP